MGVVRWTRQARDGLRLGIELLAEHAEACGVRLADGGQTHGQYRRALLFPAGETGLASLITAGFPFRENGRVWINQDGEERRLAGGQRELAGVPRHRAHLEHGEQKGDRREGALAARQHGQRLRLLARRPGDDLDTRLGEVAGLGEAEAGEATAEELPRLWPAVSTAHLFPDSAGLRAFF